MCSDRSVSGLAIPMLLVGFLALGGIAPEFRAQQPEGRLGGRVVDAEHGAPLAGAHSSYRDR